MSSTIVKTEAMSPTFTSKKLDIVDKWRARVLFCGDEENSWIQKIDKHMAVLRVSYPFLTERQLRGKAWKSCGLNSIMGGVPRVGLSPKIKKEFVKQEKVLRRKDSHIMNQRSRIEKKKVKSEKCLEKGPFAFMDSPQYSQVQITNNYPPVSSGFKPLSEISATSPILSKFRKMATPEKKKLKKVTFKVDHTPSSNVEEIEEGDKPESTTTPEFSSVKKSNYPTLGSYISPHNYFNLDNTPSPSSENNCFIKSRGPSLSSLYATVNSAPDLEDMVTPSQSNMDFSPSKIPEHIFNDSDENLKQKLEFAEICDDKSTDGTFKEALNTQDLLKSALKDCSISSAPDSFTNSNVDLTARNLKEVYLDQNLNQSTNKTPAEFSSELSINGSLAVNNTVQPCT